jgi:putative ABC transport system permease protein
VAAVLILAVGIGATTTIYSVVDKVMLRPLPYPYPDRLVHFGGYGGTRPLMYVQWRDNLESFDAVGAARGISVNFTGEGPPQRLRASQVSPDFLGFLGAEAHLGRLFMRDDYGVEGSVGLLGYGFWQRNWGGDPAIIGQQIQVEGRPVVVAGILSPDFDPPDAITGDQVDLWLPLDADDEEIATWSVLSVAGRLKEGVGLAGAQAELNAFTTHLAEELPDYLVRRDGSTRLTRLLPLSVATFRNVGGTLVILMISVWFLLLIACANVANLLLAHGTARFREIALRGALGASRGRIFRQLITESLALAVVGGGLGVGLAFLGVKAFLRFNPGGVPRIEELAVDPRVLFFALLASVVTGLIFGTAPALHASRKDAAEAIKEGAAASSASRRGRRTRSVLVVAEIALALVLLTGAGLLFRSLLAQARVDPGFDSEVLVSVPLHLGSGYTAADRQEFTRAVAERIEAIPGTEGVAAGLTVPFEFLGASKCCISNEVEGEGAPPEVEPLPMVMMHPVTPGYFRTLGAEVTQGREFEISDESGEGLVAVINEPTARYFFGTDDVVGRSVRIGTRGAFGIVGVIRGVRHWGVPQGIQTAVYVPYGPWGAFSDIYQLLVRSTADLETLVPRIREAIWSVDPQLPAEEIVPMRQRVETSLASQRFLSILLGTFATVALILATGGIYASMLYTVGQRRQEMGIRLALGGGSGRVVGLVLRGGLVLTVLGIGIGIAVSVGFSTILRSWLWGVSPTDRVTLIGVVLLLGTSALLATLIPALKAARTSPLDTLKVE